MGSIRFDQVNKFFGPKKDGLKVLENINLDIAEKEFVAIVGPSGCGKTTCLRIVAGFEQPTTGTVVVNNRRVTGPGPDRAVVFQHFALFPWKTVRQNIELGLRNKGLPREERSDLVAGVLNLMGLESHARLSPICVSGGSAGDQHENGYDWSNAHSAPVPLGLFSKICFAGSEVNLIWIKMDRHLSANYLPDCGCCSG